MNRLKLCRVSHAAICLLSCALTACGSSVQAIKYPPPLPPLNGKVTLDLADSALEDSQPTLALHVTQAILAKNLLNAPAWQRQGDAYFALGQLPEAEQSYNRALRVAPNMPAAELGLGRVELARDPAAAEARFQRLVSADPANTSALNDLGVARDMAGHHAEAQAAYRQALARAPLDEATRVNLGLSLALSGQAADAIGILAPLAARPDATPKIRQDYSVALVLAGRTGEAEKLLGQDLKAEDVAAAIRGYQMLPVAPAVAAIPAPVEPAVAHGIPPDGVPISGDVVPSDPSAPLSR
jgi:Flp pilus assembly protein TadD